MCADIHDGQGQNVPSKGRIQMSKTNHLQIVTSGLHRTAGPYRRAITGLTQCSNLRGYITQECPLIANNRLARLVRTNDQKIF